MLFELLTFRLTGGRMGKIIDDIRNTIAKHPAGSGADRRRRWRMKIVEPVHIRGGIGTMDLFEDICKSVDATRDGLLVSTSRGGYWVEQILQVIFPYWTAPTAINTPRKAKVVRNVLNPDFRFSVAVQFLDGKLAEMANEMSGIGVRVLSVEPDPAIAAPVRDLLERDGYHVVVVATPQEAVGVLMSQAPDVLLAETEGKGMSGRDLCAMIKRDDRLQHIPVILLSKSAMPSDYSANHRVGAVVSMSKPCDPERLQRAVHMLVPPPTAQTTVYGPGVNMNTFVRTS
jgi:CheY-like chemotaxis protein